MYGQPHRAITNGSNPDRPKASEASTIRNRDVYEMNAHLKTGFYPISSSRFAFPPLITI